MANELIISVSGLRGIVGDTLTPERQQMLRKPPHILVTTPESLYILLTAAKSRELLRNVETVIVDEIHAVADDKRGAHLALTLERLSALVQEEHGREVQRIGLSATQRPLEEIATFLGGYSAPGKRRPVTVVDAGSRKPLEVEVIVPVEDMASLGTVVEGPVGGGPAAAGPVRQRPACAQGLQDRCA